MKNKLSMIVIAVILLVIAGSFAHAADLRDYPYPFINNGILDNTVIVIGAESQPTDTIGGFEIAASLQAEAVTKIRIPVTQATPPKITDGTRIGKTASNPNYGETIREVHAGAFTSEELPVVLADGSFRFKVTPKTYTQKIELGENIGKFVFTRPDDMARDNYLYIEEDEKFYDYYLEFDKALSYDKTDIGGDFRGRKITFQNKEFDIAAAKGTLGRLNELTLVVPNTMVWLLEKQPLTYGEKTISLVAVDKVDMKCMINVDGVTKTVKENREEVINEVPIKVVDVIARRRLGRADMCQISLSDTTWVLRDGERITINDDPIRGSKVTFLGEAGSWEGLKITYTSGQDRKGVNSDNIYLASGEAWIDPVFGSWKILFAGITANYEDLNFKSAREKASFAYTNQNNLKVTIPYYYEENTGTLRLGTAKRPLILPGESLEGKNEDLQLLYTTSKGDTRILEITEVSCSGEKSTITIQDMITGNILARDRKIENGCDGEAKTFSLGSLGSIQLGIDTNSIEYYDTYGNGVPKTKYGATLEFTSNSITITEKSGKETEESEISFILGWSNKQIEIVSITIDGEQPAWVGGDREDSARMAVTSKGTTLKYKATFLDIRMPEDDAYANIYLAPTAATLAAEEGYTSDRINFFGTDFAVLDTKAENMNMNMIVIGGPCVNSIAKELLKITGECTKGFTPGKAMLKFFERNGKTVLLVAGHSAEDTTMAAEVLARYKEYGLTGQEVELTNTGGGYVLQFRT